MHVIGHDHEFVKKKFSQIAIMREGFYQQTSRSIAPEDRLSVRGNRSEEEYPLRVHRAMLAKETLSSL